MAAVNVILHEFAALCHIAVCLPLSIDIFCMLQMDRHQAITQTTYYVSSVSNTIGIHH